MRSYAGLALFAAPLLASLHAAVTTTPTFTTIYNFTGPTTNGTGCAGCDGATPDGGLVVGGGGILYGVTEYGGAAGYGAVYSLAPPSGARQAWTETVLHSFTASEGVNPSGTLAVGPGGVFYGTTQYGGGGACSAPGLPQGCGTLFSIAPPSFPGGGWSYATIYSFQGNGDGALPDLGLSLDASGTLYGATNSGGPNNCFGAVYIGCGVIFSLSPPTKVGGSWTETVLTDTGTLGFSTGFVSGLVAGNDGNKVTVYAAAANSQSLAVAAVFALSPPAANGGAWQAATLYTFPNNQRPSGSITLGYGGVLYGSTVGETTGPGSTGQDQIFSLSPPSTAGAAWTETVLFNLPPDTLPASSLTFSGGVLYGTFIDPTCSGPCGTLYSLTPPASGTGLWTQATLHLFTGGTDGGTPNGGLLVSANGILYGTTQTGGASGAGTAYSLPLAVPEPVVNAGGVVNGASYQVPVAPGSIASVFGGFFLPVSAGAVDLPLTDNILDLSFTFDGDIAAPLIWVSPGQANMQVPWEMANDPQATLSATLYGQTSAAQTVSMATFAPGIFTTNAQGTGPGAILDQNYKLVDSSNPATAGATVLQIFCTGLGAVTNQPATGAPAPLSPLAETITIPSVTIGGVSADVTFHGLAPGYVGLYQVNAAVPAGIASGGAVPLSIAIGGASSNTVTIAVQ